MDIYHPVGVVAFLSLGFAHECALLWHWLCRVHDDWAERLRSTEYIESIPQAWRFMILHDPASNPAQHLTIDQHLHIIDSWQHKTRRCIKSHIIELLVLCSCNLSVRITVTNDVVSDTATWHLSIAPSVSFVFTWCIIYVGYTTALAAGSSAWFPNMTKRLGFTNSTSSSIPLSAGPLFKLAFLQVATMVLVIAALPLTQTTLAYYRLSCETDAILDIFIKWIVRAHIMTAVLHIWTAARPIDLFLG